MIKIGILPVWLVYIFLLVGIGFSALFVALLIVSLLERLSEWIKHANWQYKYKHRFNKPPLAKCYCRDCMNFASKWNRCLKYYDTCTEYHFCSYAEPKEKDPEKDKMISADAEVKDCGTCKHAKYNDHWGTVLCHSKEDCRFYDKWERKEDG